MPNCPPRAISLAHRWHESLAEQKLMTVMVGRGSLFTKTKRE
jgi:hypothetical protein